MSAQEPIQVDNRKDLLLLILAAPGQEDAEPILGVTRLQKYLLLLQQQFEWDRKFGIDEPYNYAPDNFGPFDPQLYDDLELLQNVGLIDRSPAGPEPSAENEESRRWAQEWATVDREFNPWEEENQIKRYFLTERGKDFVRRLQVDDDARSHLAQLKRQWNQRPLQEFLRWVYKTYPQWAENTQLEHLRP